jgi:GMP synthase (glutamine-hydrolysing)
MTRVGILETGKPSAEVAGRYGDFVDMFRAYFAAQSDLGFVTYPVSSGAPLPTPSAENAWLITGSPAGVYEDHAWMPPLEEFVRQAIRQSVSVLGICFGHQLMAKAMGGKVVKSDKGRGIGVHRYEVNDAGQKLLPQTKTLHLIAAHQDQIAELPQGATLLASSSFCPYAALAYDNVGLSIQPHPEFTIDSGRAITRDWQEEEPTAHEVLAAAEDSFGTLPVDSAFPRRFSRPSIGTLNVCRKNQFARAARRRFSRRRFARAPAPRPRQADAE